MSFLVGPHFTFRNGSRLTPFVHALAGYSGDKFSLYEEKTLDEVLWDDDAGEFVADSKSASGRAKIRTSNSFGVLAGGGLDLSINDSWAVRLVQADYYISRHDDPIMEGFSFTSLGKALYTPGEKELLKNIALSFGIVFKF